MQTNKNPLVSITMQDGAQMQLELFPRVAPNTVNNFIALARQGYYDGLIFHRVIPGFMIQGGDPQGTGTGGPGYAIAGEFAANGFPNALAHKKGVISMARSMAPNSAGSQFFIMVADYPSLDGQYAAFGQMVQGQEVADRIAALPRDHNDRPLEEATIQKVTVELFGGSYPPPQKLS